MIATTTERTFGPKRTFRDKLFDYSSKKIGKERTKFFFKLYDLGRFDFLASLTGQLGR
ncbi:MAG: hypothetical protein AAB069_01500 [Planctomycetota bacterium]